MRLAVECDTAPRIRGTGKRRLIVNRKLERRDVNAVIARRKGRAGNSRVCVR